MLKEKLQEDLKVAMKSHDEIVVSTLRMALSIVKNKEIDKKADLTEEELVKLLSADKKKRLDSIQQFSTGGRADLVEKEKKELAVLEKYLPAQMPEEELMAAVMEVVSSLPPADQKNFGTVMKSVLAAVGGRADGGRVSALVKKLLNK